MARDVDTFLMPMQKLGHLPDDQLKAEAECKRILDRIDDDKDESAKDIGAGAGGTDTTAPQEQDEGGHLLKRPEFTGEDSRDVRAVLQIEELIETAGQLARKEREAPRVSAVREQIETIKVEAPKLAAILEDKYVLEELDLAQAFEDNEAFLQEPDAEELVQSLRKLSVLAERALERKELHISEDGNIQHGARALDDTGGSRKATSLSGFPVKTEFVARCLAVFEEHRPGEWSTHVDGPFAVFAKDIWQTGTGEEASLKDGIENVSNMLENGKDRKGRRFDLAKIIDLRLTTNARRP